MAEIYLARPSSSSGPAGRARAQAHPAAPRGGRALRHDVPRRGGPREQADPQERVPRARRSAQFAGTWFIAMEYLHGVPLSRMMTRLSKAGKMLDFRVVAGIICQACEGLHAAHEARGPDGATARCRASRRLAAEHHGDRRRHREAARLRHREGARRELAHAHRHGQGQERVHVARADPRQAARPAQRRVRARGRDVRDARDQAAVPSRLATS